MSQLGNETISKSANRQIDKLVNRSINMKYPHYLFVMTTSQSQRRSDGTWTETTLTPVFLCRCREEVNSKGQEVPLANSLYHHVQKGNASFHRFASVIYFPQGVDRLPVGAQILVSDDPEGKKVRVVGIVQKCDIGQFHSRLWI